MKTSIFNTIFIEEPKDFFPHPEGGMYISVKLKTVLENFVSTYSPSVSFSKPFPCLFECVSACTTVSAMPHFELKHDVTWDDFGRAYYQSRSYHYEPSAYWICSVDEIRQQIERWNQTHAPLSNCVVIDGMVPVRRVGDLFQSYLEEHYGGQLRVMVERTARRLERGVDLLSTEGHTCLPFSKASIDLHLAQPASNRQALQRPIVQRPCCRSFLRASCHPSSGDDLLGH